MCVDYVAYRMIDEKLRPFKYCKINCRKTTFPNPNYKKWSGLGLRELCSKSSSLYPPKNHFFIIMLVIILCMLIIIVIILPFAPRKINLQHYKSDA